MASGARVNDTLTVKRRPVRCRKKNYDACPRLYWCGDGRVVWLGPAASNNLVYFSNCVQERRPECGGASLTTHTVVHCVRKSRARQQSPFEISGGGNNIRGATQ